MRRGLLLGLALTGGALAQMEGMDHGGHTVSAPTGMDTMSTSMLAELRPLRNRAFDVRFVQRMMDHHQMAIDMARAELRLGQNAQVKAAARKVISAQEKEIAQMGAWVRAWTGKTYRPKAMSMTVPGNGAERWFLTGMIPHHQGAVEMAKLVPARTENAAVRKLAREIIRSQTAEINQYRAWLKALK